MKFYRLDGISGNKVVDDILSTIMLEDYEVIRGGVHVYKPMEESHKGEHHVHDHPEVFIGIRGRATMIVNGKEHEFKGGDIIVIEPGEEHHVMADKENPITLVWLDVRKKEKKG